MAHWARMLRAARRLQVQVFDADGLKGQLATR